MTTKEWLSRALNIDRDIGHLMRERRKAYDRCVSITARINAISVSETKDPYKYDKLAEYGLMLDAKINELYEAKREIQVAIMSVDNPVLREVLQRRYIDGETFEKMAVGMGREYRWIRRLHGRALQKIKIDPQLTP